MGREPEPIVDEIGHLLAHSGLEAHLILGERQLLQLAMRLVEHNRLGILKGAVGAGKTVNLIDKDLNNKFVLVTIE